MKEERGHGNHWSILGDTDEVIHDAIQNVLKNQHPDGCAKQVEISIGDGTYTTKTDLIGITDGCNGMTTLAIVACNVKGGNEIISAYPVYRSTNKLEISVVGIDKWASAYEATVSAETENGENINFFATDYYCNFDKYAIGNKLTVSLGGMAYKAKEVPESERSFGYYGQEALDWINRTGSPIEMLNHDDKTGVPYIEFCMDELTALLPLDSPFEDDAQFQSNIRSINEVKYLNVDFWVVSVYIKRDPDIEIPLLIPKKSMSIEPKEGDPIRGFLWLQGRIA